MKFWLSILIAFLTACLLAYGSFRVALKTYDSASHTIGPWKTNIKTGSAQAGIYHRAWVALYGLWALNNSEVTYFLSFTDSNNKPLDCKCDYRIEGSDLDTRWWSLAVYEDYHYIPNKLERYSINSNTVAKNKDGAWSIVLSASQKEGNWLPGSVKCGQLALSLRCYNPSEAFKANLNALPLPTITKINCR